VGAFAFGVGGLGGAGSLCGVLKYSVESSASADVVYVFAVALAAFVAFGVAAPA
jgi:hypothetical protein